MLCATVASNDPLTQIRVTISAKFLYLAPKCWHTHRWPIGRVDVFERSDLAAELIVISKCFQRTYEDLTVCSGNRGQKAIFGCANC